MEYQNIKPVLSIAGSDCSGGAGIQADIKTILANGCYAMTAITALTAQNTVGVNAVEPVSPEFLEQQLKAVFEDIRPDAVKIGMVASTELIHTIADCLKRYDVHEVVLDPVMVSTSGCALIHEDAIQALKKELFPLATILTPNIPEAELLTGMTIKNEQDIVAAGQRIMQEFDANVLLKGGHSIADANDVLVCPNRVQWFYGKRIDNPNTHGTGCTLSSAIACGLAKGYGIAQSVGIAKQYLSEALENGINLGKGSGPLNHGYTWMKQKKYQPEQYLKLYGITDREILKANASYTSLYEQIEAALRGGVTCIQIRDKDINAQQSIQELMEIKQLVHQYGVPLIINDNVEIAKQIDADGVHLGQDDMSVRQARRILGADKIIGVSAHNVEEAQRAYQDGADYLGVGAVFATSTKKDAKPLSYETLLSVCEATALKVVAIGGITQHRIRELTGSKISGVALVSALFQADDVELAARSLRSSVEQMLVETDRLMEIIDCISPVIEDKKGMIFDMDGTLLDSLPMWNELDAKYMANYGVEVDEAFHHEVATMTLIQAAAFIKEKFNIPKTAEEIMLDFQKMVCEEYAHHLKLKPLTYELLRYLHAKGKKLVIATANEIDLTLAAMKNNHMEEFADAVVSCTMAGAGKDSAKVYLLGCEKLHLPKEQCVVFEDSINAIKTSVDAGFVTIGVYDKMHAGCWEEIKKLTQEQVVFEA